MNSLGSSSKWPSYDSLPSSSSFLHSESEHTEDEADVFSDREGDGGITKLLLPDEGIRLSRNGFGFPAHSDQPLARTASGQPEHYPDVVKYPASASSPGAAVLSSSSTTPGDLVFAHKCVSLQRFIHPLLGLLHGLTTGRFDKGLSSFQKSVAVDRFQRILGILQRPEMGEKYLQILQQIEMMLKIWFPHVPCQSTETPGQTSTPRPQSQWCQNQLHMPIKKRKPNWSNHDHSGTIAPKNKQYKHAKRGTFQAESSGDIVTTSTPGSRKKHETQVEHGSESDRSHFGIGHKFTDATGALSRQTCSCHKKRKYPETSPPSPCGSTAAQDSSVSSSDSITATDSL